MLYRDSEGLKLCTKKVVYTQRGQEMESLINTEGIEWWEDFANKWDHTTITEFEDVEYTKEQLDRFEETKDLNVNQSILQDYIISGTIGEGLEILELNKENQQLKAKVEANLIATRSMIRVDELTVEELETIVGLYDGYEVGKPYIIGDILKLEGKLYKVVQAHTSQDDWKPISTKALYTELMPENVIPNWVQPTGSHDAYNIGDKVIFESKVYESLINSNTWSPTTYPSGWKEVV